MRQTKIGSPEKDGRRKVWWLVGSFWKHKGWLMPQVSHG